MNFRGLVLTITAGALLAGCGATPMASLTPATQPPSPAVSPAAYPVTRLVGSWGVASYREDKDKNRTIAQARAACKIPFIITKGPTDGVMMHVADDTSVHELTLKGGPGGKTYLGFAGPPGDDQDLEILTFTDTMFIARYVNADTNARYGTLVYVRCNGRA